MNGRYRNVEERQAIEEEAVRLYLKARESNSEQDWCAAYEWIERSPEHGVAFAKAEASWELSDRLREVAPVVGPEEVAGPAGRFEALFSRRAVAALIAATVVGTVGTVAIEKWATVDRYRTTVGQERAITLADGSTVHLNTDSTVEVSMLASERLVRLLKGEARFDVRQDAKRPFVVQAGDTRLRAIGTAFNVRLRTELTELTVIRGKVSVSDGDTQPCLVVAGVSAAIRGGTVAVTPLNPGQIAQRTAWESGAIEFNGETLAQAIDEFNRYRRTPLVIGDPQLASLRVGGTFKATSSSAFVGALAQSFGIRSVIGKDNSVILLPPTTDDAVGRNDDSRNDAPIRSTHE